MDGGFFSGFFSKTFLLCVCGGVQWIMTGEIGRRENTVLEQDRPLVVSAKEDPAFPVCSLCQGENYQQPYYKSSFAKQMLLNAKWVITPTKLCVRVWDCVRACTDVCVCYCVLLYVSFCRLCVGMYNELVCCIDEDICRFHMGVSRSILRPLVDVFLLFFLLMSFFLQVLLLAR